MSISILSWALNEAPKAHPDTSQGARHLLIYIADHFNDNEGAAWPSVARLAGLMGCAERSVQNWLNELTEAGILSKTMRTNQTNLYRFIVPTRGASPAPGGASPAPLGVNHVHPNSYKRLNNLRKPEDEEPVPYWELPAVPLTDESKAIIENIRRAL